MAVPTVRSVATKYYTGQIADVGTAAVGCVIVFKGRGEIRSISATVRTALTTTATVLTPVVKDSAGTTVATLGDITLGATMAASSSVTVDYVGTAVDDGFTLTITSDGGTDATSVGYVTVAVKEG